MNPDTLVSIITPCYNTDAFLGQTYESLRNQTHESWEWLVADDGSTDSSRELIEGLARHDPRVKLIALRHSGLPAVARNAAIRAASGKYIAFLDADDLWLPEKLRLQVETLENDKKIGLTWCHVEEFWDDGRQSAPVFWRRLDLPPNCFNEILVLGNIICTSSILMRASLIQQIGFQNEDPGLKSVEDHEFLLRAARVSRFARTKGNLVRYRRHESNISLKTGPEHFRTLVEVLNKNDFLKGKAGREFRSGFYTSRAEHALAGDIIDNYRLLFFKAWRERPLKLRRWIGLLSIFLPRKWMLKLWSSLKKMQARIEGEKAAPHFMSREQKRQNRS